MKHPRCVVLAGAFHHLTVDDAGDSLSIRFGPVPLFRRIVRYEDMSSVEVSQTTFLDGWGIHMSVRGGWVWNLWGRDCVVIHMLNRTLRVGSDDWESLAEYLKCQLPGIEINSSEITEDSFPTQRLKSLHVIDRI
jgi:hypothetical protein